MKNVLNEKLGILIFESESMLLEEMKALCIFHSEVPIILLNGKDSVNRRIFSLFHELTHLLLGEVRYAEIMTALIKKSSAMPLSENF